MRRLEVLVGQFRDARLSPAQGQAIASIVSFFPPGFAVAVRFLPIAIPRDSTRITEEELNDALNSLVRQQPLPQQGVWRVVLLSAGSLNGDISVLGVMFDRILPGRPREGCAIFLKSIGEDQALLRRTAAHEVGHALNLCHCDDGQVDGIMTDGGLSNNPRFSQRSIQHLLNHEDLSVMPGGHRFGERRCNHGPCVDCQVSALALPSPGRKIRIELSISRGKAFKRRPLPTFVIGEPVSVRITIRNGSARSVSVRRTSSTRDGSVKLWALVDGEVRPLPPPILTCFGEVKAKKLLSGQTHVISELLCFRGGKVVMASPGEITLQAAVHVGGHEMASNRTTVVGVAPETARHRKSVRIASDPSVAFAVESGDISKSAVRRRLKTLRSFNPKFPLLQVIREELDDSLT